MSDPAFLPVSMWEQGTTDNSVPSNDNALLFEISQRNVNNATTAQPVSPADGDTYIIQSTHTGAVWSTFTPKSVAIYKVINGVGSWYARAPTEGQRVSVSGVSYIYASGAWTAATGGAYDMFSTLASAEISVTGATTATLGRMHVCSGTSADYTLTLPAVSGNAGKFLGVRMAPGLTRWVTLDGNSSELIDGSLTRKMWANEVAILLCDGSAWTKVAGKSIPIQTIMYRTTGKTLGATTWTIVQTPTVSYDNTSGLAVPAGDTSGGVVKVLRDGSYNAEGFACASGITAGVVLAGGAMAGNASTDITPTGNPNAWMGVAAATNGFGYASGSGTFRVSSGTNFYITVYNGMGSSITTQTSTEVRPTLSVIEVPSW